MGLSCAALNATDGANFLIYNECACTSTGFLFFDPSINQCGNCTTVNNKFLTPSGTYSPIPLPRFNLCVADCSIYYLTVNPSLQCVTCLSLNSALPVFDPVNNTCVSTGGCPVGTVRNSVNNFCSTNCKDASKFRLHNDCYTGSTCAATFNATNASTFSTDNKCLCTGKKFFPLGITAYTPITNSTSPICVTNCSAYYLTFIPNEGGFENDKCASCESVNPALPNFDPVTNSCKSDSDCANGAMATPNKFCSLNCKTSNSFLLHGACYSGTNCSTFNASNGPNYSTNNDCLCTNKYFFFPSSITSFSPITKPTSPTCVTSCSAYFLTFNPNDINLVNDKCVSCETLNPALPLFENLTNTCVSTCPLGTQLDAGNKLCLTNCKVTNKIKFNHLCNSIVPCSTYNAQESSTFSTDSTCTCGTNKKYFSENVTAFTPISKSATLPICVTNCSDYFLSFVNGGYGNDSCNTCMVINPSISYFDTLTKLCVPSCGLGLISKEMPSTGTVTNKYCQNCKDTSQLNVNNGCVTGDTCAVFDMVEGPNYATMNYCVTCTISDPTKTYYYKDQKICVNTCPDATDTNSSLKTCKNKPVVCPSIKQVSVNGVCQPCVLPKYYMEFTNSASILDSKCIDLVVEKLYVLKGSTTLLSKCPDKTISDTDNICHDCLYYQQICLLACPANTFYNTDNVCETCLEKKLFLYKNKCVTSCPYDITNLITTTANVKNECVTCSEAKKYIGATSCLDTCPDNLVQDNIAFKCINCKTTTQIKFSNTCVTQCPIGYEADKDSLVCILSKIYVYLLFSCLKRM